MTILYTKLSKLIKIHWNLPTKDEPGINEYLYWKCGSNDTQHVGYLANSVNGHQMDTFLMDIAIYWRNFMNNYKNTKYIAISMLASLRCYLTIIWPMFAGMLESKVQKRDMICHSWECQKKVKTVFASFNPTQPDFILLIIVHTTSPVNLRRLEASYGATI